MSFAGSPWKRSPSLIFASATPGSPPANWQQADFMNTFSRLKQQSGSEAGSGAQSSISVQTAANAAHWDECDL